jgi:hypothetical protein
MDFSLLGISRFVFPDQFVEVISTLFMIGAALAVIAVAGLATVEVLENRRLRHEQEPVPDGKVTSCR